MIYLKRFLWLAAWSVWVWLGFGLYRELPRDLGPAVCRLPLGEDDDFHGFLADEPKLVTCSYRFEPESDLVQVWDAGTGRLLHRMELPPESGGGIENFSPTNEYVVTERRPEGPRRETDRKLSVLDVRTGKWFDLPKDARWDPIFHEGKPWVAFRSDPSESDERTNVCVVDLRNGKELFRWNGKRAGKQDRGLDEDPFFIGDRLAIPTETQIREGEFDISSTYELEIWTIPAGAAPDEVVEGLNLDDDPTASASGRIACHIVHAGPTTTDVYDLKTRSFVFSDPPRETRQPPFGGVSGAWNGPILSDDGRLVYSTMADKLYNVDTGGEIRSKKGDATDFRWNRDDQIEITEKWSPPFVKGLEQKTFATRDVWSGRLLHRSWTSTIDRRLHQGSYFFDPTTKTVYEKPLRVNYPLLALCQTILALPLILLWAVLRWRRKRPAIRAAST